MSWAELTETQGLVSGLAPTAADLDTAQDIVEIFAGATEIATDDGLVGSRDLRLLNRAVLYQAVFVAAHPDILIGRDLQSFSQDGVSATPAHANSHILAPLAKRCIDRLSWKTRGLFALPATSVSAQTRASRNSAAADDQRRWSSL